VPDSEPRINDNAAALQCKSAAGALPDRP
jgi:hypothetical protein